VEIKYSKQFIKNLKLRIRPDKKLYDKFKECAELFILDSSDPVLRDHQLTREKKNYRAFSVTSEIRVLYYVTKDYVFFTDIGTHEEVY
jgi:addiction module RelE/StbE family toxin